ncbi:TlpA family protein disulfide reductase [Pedobacter sp. GR22-10]|uniref:TlpA family protein disulfide reductase n=1 Tax=Pedobacter sp. GR22-10 TaxID=2994472 RepID=UPI002247A743|nr:TlpA disulfide reductase family protein [Pedobacter sp. GR22-10]MCX2429901.1 TlpA disulfide reductase family protein [Pedobacter sp. GR22-10]
MKKLIYIILAFAFINCKAQQTETELPTVGKAMPDFQLNDVHYYGKKKVFLRDFKGQWLILDFWNQYCGVCLSSQPRINVLQSKFKGRVQFLLVGYTGSQYKHGSNNKSIRKLYERNRKDNNLNLVIAYDSLLMHRYEIKPTPYMIIIDPDGVVRGITTHVTESELQDLISGKPVKLVPAYHSNKEALLARPKK